MRRLLRPGAVIVAALICWFGVGGLQAASPVAAPAAVATYMHDDPHLAEGMSVAAERDPPAGYEPDTAYDYDAFDRWSRGTLARPGLDSTPDPNTYDDSARLAQVVRGIATTERGVRATGETSVAFDHYGVAANGGRVFWSGGDMAKSAAADFARASGGKTIEMTRTGRALEWLTNKTSYNLTKPLWERASARFAKGASGEVYVFFGPGGPSVFSVYSNIENQILQSNGVRIFTHWAWE